MKTRYHFLLLLLFVATIQTTAQNLRTVIHEFEKQNPGVSFSCSFIDNQTKEEVFSHNQSSLTPASIMKVVSGATAMQSLGSDYRFCTKLAYSGSISKDGALNGNLIVVSGGDPSFESKKFSNRIHIAKLFAENVKLKGIKTINGKLIVDLSHLGPVYAPGSWLYEDLGNYYGAAPSSLTCYDNLFLITLKSGAVGTKTTVVKTSPTIPVLNIENLVTAAKANKDNAYIYSAPYSFDQQIRGSIPANRSAFTIKASLPNPPKQFANTLLSELKKQGIKCDGCKIQLQYEAIKTATTNIYIDKSPVLSKVIIPMLHKSINLIADHIFLEPVSATSEKVSFKTASSYTLNHWAKKEIQTKGNYIEDGSGLSRANAIQTKFVASVLQNISQDEKVGKAFIQALPQVGKEGTVRYYFQDKIFAHTMRAKTGSMTRVKSLAGVMGSIKEKQYSFCVITNNYSCSSTDVVRFYGKLFEAFYNGY